MKDLVKDDMMNERLEDVALPDGWIASNVLMINVNTLSIMRTNIPDIRYSLRVDRGSNKLLSWSSVHPHVLKSSRFHRFFELYLQTRFNTVSLPGHSINSSSWLHKPE